MNEVDKIYHAEFIEDPIGKKLSEFIHANSSSAIPIEPFIGNPNLFSFSPFGTYNYNSIHSMRVLVNKQIAFIGANVALILKDKVWFDLGTSEDIVNEIKSIMMAFNALSSCYDNCCARCDAEPDMDNFMSDEDYP